MFHHPLIQGDFIFGVKGQYKDVKVKKKLVKIQLWLLSPVTNKLGIGYKKFLLKNDM